MQDKKPGKRVWISWQLGNKARALVDAIPFDELPDGSDRTALGDAICHGEVADVYYGASGRHYVTISGLDAAGVSERVTLADWVALTRDGLSAEDMRAVLIERDCAQEGA